MTEANVMSSRYKIRPYYIVHEGIHGLIEEQEGGLKPNGSGQNRSAAEKAQSRG